MSKLENCFFPVPQARKASLARFLEKRKERFDFVFFFFIENFEVFQLNLKELMLLVQAYECNAIQEDAS